MINIERLGQEGKQKLNELVIAETFSHRSFANFVMAMRGLVGLAEPERPNVPSNGFPAKGLGIKGYLEFNGGGNAANIAIVREKFKYRHDFGRRALFLEQQPEHGFSLKMATWPAYSSDIPDIERLLNIDGINFTQDADPPYNGKGGIIWTRASLSENIVQNFCRKIVEQVQTLPPNYIFVAGETIAKRSKTLKAKFLDLYFRQWV